MKFDSKDERIIRELKQDSRQSIRDIAKKAKLRPSTVHERIKRLLRNGVIEQFTLKLDNRAVGENFIAFMFVSSEKEIPAAVFSDPHIKEAFGITGEYDLLLKLKFRDVEEFNRFVIKFRKETGIRKTLTMVSTVNIKEEL
jgi:DNA-binding Lrp family transcriptional regulator